MNKSKKILIFLIIIISIILIVGISFIAFDTKGKINQGSFRVNDVVLKSVVELNENGDKDADNNSISSITFSLSQKNTISILISKEVEASQVYIDNIYLKAPNKKGNMYIYQTGTDIDDITSQQNITIYPTEKDNQYFIEISMDNINLLENTNLPENTLSATFDGTILGLLNIGISDIEFYVNFDLNIVDKNSKINTCKIKLKLPENELLVNGISINRKDKSDYVFSVK